MEVPAINAEDDDQDDEEEDDNDNNRICSNDDEVDHQRRRRTSNSCCTSLALIITLLLLLRNVYELVGVDDGAYDPLPFSIPTVLILKGSGIILPVFVLFRILTLFLNTIHNYRPPHFYSYAQQEHRITLQ